jgi:hypothetical protein
MMALEDLKPISNLLLHIACPVKRTHGKQQYWLEECRMWVSEYEQIPFDEESYKLHESMTASHECMRNCTNHDDQRKLHKIA